MRILGLDTATWSASVGLVNGGSVVAERTETANGSHAVSLLPLIDAVLRQGASSVAEIDAVAVSSGPGSFTGLRIGLSVAKGLARATGARLVAVPTLEALARTVALPRGVVCTLLDARKGELYAACFEAEDGSWRRLTADATLLPEAVVEKLPQPAVVAGDGVAAHADFLRQHWGAAVTLLPDLHGPRGSVIAAMGWEALQAGNAADLTSFEPCYVRPPDATPRSP